MTRRCETSDDAGPHFHTRLFCEKVYCLLRLQAPGIKTNNNSTKTRRNVRIAVLSALTQSPSLSISQYHKLFVHVFSMCMSVRIRRALSLSLAIHLLR